VSLNVLAESDTVDAAFVASNKESTAALGPLDFDYASTSGDLGKTWFGARQGSALDYDGLIDDLAYFDGLLTDAEIAGAFIGIYPTYDSDGDGIDDAWEFGYWGNLTNANHATAHDADPYSDLDEYIADTDPTNPNSSFRIERAEYRGGANIHFDSSTNRRYTLWFADSLFGSVWSNLPGQTRRPGLGPGDLMIDTNAVPRRYYRVEVSLP